ncbi:MAG TPA: hypothetical protein VGO62_22095, partial [Myxococcota bacterium]
MLALLRRAWPHVVAAFVIYHVVANALDCIPEVSMGMNKAAWHEPRVRHELDVWAARLGVERRSFEDELWALGQTFQGVRRAMLTPFRPYLNATAQHQAWAMFIAGTRDRDRFEVRARSCSGRDEDCDWRTLYARDDDDHAFLRDILESPRVRSAIFRWGWPQNKASYQRGCRAIAKR